MQTGQKIGEDPWQLDYRAYCDITKRVDRVCTEAIEVKKEEKLGGKFFLVYLYINLATS